MKPCHCLYSAEISTSYHHLLLCPCNNDKLNQNCLACSRLSEKSLPYFLSLADHGQKAGIVGDDYSEQLVHVCFVMGQILFQPMDGAHHLSSVHGCQLLSFGHVSWKQCLQVFHVDRILPYCLHCFISVLFQLLQLRNLIWNVKYS